ncbi:hypothetical protein BCR32DRAFT_294528 [Anaeromyces robustus]|uniref:Uncharacterized protein n=1 Tax=Anaeromyces robustus TaxID=1754192 RepID=A0A1Y1X0J1_9FUNG|nr:hypothetical protein BCR32DRAFT_294528 [Anaeromyces robustus]|eukprot:ORX79300.1 hypothetical protein BCR32DRAFT_294528 [Anaeromyces robustus]
MKFIHLLLSLVMGCTFQWGAHHFYVKANIPTEIYFPSDKNGYSYNDSNHYIYIQNFYISGIAKYYQLFNCRYNVKNNVVFCELIKDDSHLIVKYNLKKPSKSCNFDSKYLIDNHYFVSIRLFSGIFIFCHVSEFTFFEGRHYPDKLENITYRTSNCEFETNIDSYDIYKVEQ